MKIGIVGSRSLDLENVKNHMFSFLNGKRDKIDEIVSGGAAGPDTFAYEYVMANGGKFTLYRPDWKKYGKSAGFKRNVLIVNDSDVIIAFWDGASRGAKHSIDYAIRHGKKVIVFIFDEVSGEYIETKKFI